MWTILIGDNVSLCIAKSWEIQGFMDRFFSFLSRNKSVFSFKNRSRTGKTDDFSSPAAEVSLRNRKDLAHSANSSCWISLITNWVPTWHNFNNINPITLRKAKIVCILAFLRAPELRALTALMFNAGALCVLKEIPLNTAVHFSQRSSWNVSNTGERNAKFHPSIYYISHVCSSCKPAINW